MLHSELIPAAEKNSRLMVMLHGLGDSIEGYRWLPEAMNLPWLNYLFVNAPDEYYGGCSWFDFRTTSRPEFSAAGNCFLNCSMICARKNFQTEQTTLGGFSQGCLMAIEVGLRYPHRFAGLVGISGWVFEPAKLLKELSPVALQQRLLMTHGASDPIIPIEKVRTQIPLLKAAGINVEWREFPKAHTIHGEIELAVIREFVRAGYPVVGG